jgi:hypothetical protein
MTLRTVVLLVTLVALVFSIFGVISNGENWPIAILLSGIAAALAFERHQYGKATSKPPGTGWLQTSETFIDDSSGQPVSVWFNAETGERRYVAINSKNTADEPLR